MSGANIGSRAYVHGFLIEPGKQRVVKASLIPGEELLHQMKNLIGGSIGMVTVDVGVDLVYNDEGLYNAYAAFTYHGYPFPDSFETRDFTIPGSALLFGYNDEGETISCPLDQKTVEQAVTFLTLPEIVSKVGAILEKPIQVY